MFTETYSGSCQTSKMELFATIVYYFKPVTIFAKHFHRYLKRSWVCLSFTPVDQRKMKKNKGTKYTDKFSKNCFILSLQPYILGFGRMKYSSYAMFPLYRIVIVAFRLSYWIGLLFPLDCLSFTMIIVSDSSWSAPILKVTFRSVLFRFINV